MKQEILVIWNLDNVEDSSLFPYSHVLLIDREVALTSNVVAVVVALLGLGFRVHSHCLVEGADVGPLLEGSLVVDFALIIYIR